MKCKGFTIQLFILSCKEIYSSDTGPSFHGNGERYHVFRCKDEKEINQSLHWEDNKNKAIESSIMEVLNKLNVPKKNMPNFEKNYKYYTKMKEDSSKIYLIFITETKEIYVIEELI